MYPVFTGMPAESCHWQPAVFVECLCDAFPALMNSLVHNNHDSLDKILYKLLVLEVHSLPPA